MAERSYNYVTSADDLGMVAQAIADSKHMGLDIETTGLDALTCKVRLLSITTDAGTWVVDLFQTYGPGMRIKHALNNYRGIVIGNHIKFDVKFLMHHYGVEFQRVFDTFRASAMLYNGHPTITGHNLYDLQERYLGLQVDREKDYGASDWSGTLSKVQLDYAAADTQHLIPLYRALVPLLQEAGLVEACRIEFAAILPEAEIELNGFRLDAAMWRKRAQTDFIDSKVKEDALLHKLPHPSGQMGLFGCTEFNLDSQQQVIKSFSRLGTELPDTDKTTMAQYASQQPLIVEFMEYRKTQKKVTSFGVDYLDYIHPRTRRIHTSFWPLTGAGRYSSSNPNLQQVPTEESFRACFRPEEGHKLVLADYSQIELRIGAHITKDPILTKVFTDNEDAHQRTASILSGTPYGSVTKEQRKQAKPINFGLIYGMGPPKLVTYALTNYGVVFSLQDAQRFHGKYFKAYRQVKEWHRDVWDRGQREKLSRTLSGRLRYLDPETDFNEFKNTPIQGSGADGLKASLPIVRKKLRQADSSIRMVHMVHDEIIAEVRSDPELCRLAEAAISTGMVEGMTQVMKSPSVPIVAEASTCDSWAEK